MRSEFIITQIRPIKKLFIIENGDYESLSAIFLQLQTEIDSIFNLIFINDDSLWSQSTADFVKRCDPDIILNFSVLDNDKLSAHFNIMAADPRTDQFKISRFGTPLSCFSNKPAFIKTESKNEKFRVLTAGELANDPKALFECINYGLANPELLEHIQLTIFEKMRLEKVDESTAIKELFNHEDKFADITTAIGNYGGSGHGSSIYEISYNKEHLFEKANTRYFFASSHNDYKALCFFWNTRSYYNYSNLAWIPLESINSFQAYYDDKAVFVCFSDQDETVIREKYPDAEIIRPQRLFFQGRNERWAFYQHTQTINVSEEAIIQHPLSKSFSDLGLGSVFVLEVRGLTEAIFPKKRNLGTLFLPEAITEHYPLFAERFLRISETGLAKYIFEFEPLRSADIIAEFAIPGFSKMMNHVFEDAGLEIKRTNKSSIFEQTLNLFGGFQGLADMADEKLFELLISLTPNVRTEKVAKKLMGEGTGLNSEDVLEIIGEIRERGAINFPSVTLTIDELLARLGTKVQRKKYIALLQGMFDRRILLRGKFFECSHCNSKLWLQIDEIRRVNYCHECSNEIRIPVYGANKEASDHYRLNQLVVRAVDQGQVSTLLLLNFFKLQKFTSFFHASNLEVFENSSIVTDIDLLVKLGKRIGLAECKSSGGFTEKQVDDLIKIGQKIKCHFLAFSSLLASDSNDIKNLTKILERKNLDIPAFIITRSALFNIRPRAIQNYFELLRSEEFPVGPIIL